MVVVNHRETLLSSCLPLIASALADFCLGSFCDMGAVLNDVRLPLTNGPSERKNCQERIIRAVDRMTVSR
jgi:hypothetical protein